MNTDTLTPLDLARRPKVAALKRVFELWTLDTGADAINGMVERHMRQTITLQDLLGAR